MKAMFAGFGAAVLIAIAANLALKEIGFSSQDRFSGTATRLEGAN